MRGKAIIPLVLGLAIGVATVKLLVDTIRKARAASGPATTITLVQAARDIGAFDEITPNMVKSLETVDNALIPKSQRIEKLEGAIGRVAAKPIPQGVALLRSMLAPKGTPPGMTGRIPPGFRAVSVRIDEVTGVAFQLRPGDWVDVFVVMDVDAPSTGRRETIAEVILQHIQVVAVGYLSDERRQPGKPSIKPAKSATLLVEEQDVPKLHLAATHGRITLAMRGADDLTTDTARRARLSELTNPNQAEPKVAEASKTPGWIDALGAMISKAEAEPARPAPAKTRPAPDRTHSVVVVHGGAGAEGRSSVERITFENGHSQRILSVGTGPVSGPGNPVGGRFTRVQRAKSPQSADRSETPRPERDLRDD